MSVRRFVGVISGRVVTTKVVYFSLKGRRGVVGQLDAVHDERRRKILYPGYAKGGGMVVSRSKEEIAESVVALLLDNFPLGVFGGDNSSAVIMKKGGKERIVSR